MKIKDFFKPTIWNIILTIVLFLIISQTAIKFNNFKLLIPDDVPEFGFPFGFYSSESSSFGMKLDKPIVYFSFINLILNLAIWYLLACIVVFIFKKDRKRK